LSALFSGSIKMTILGRGFEINSFSMMVTLFLLMFFVARLFQTKKKVIYFYTSLLFASIFMLFFHVLRLIFGPDFLSMGIFQTTTSNLVGTWNELGIFFGLIAVLSLLTIVFMKENKTIKIVSYITLVGSLLFVILVNFLSVWLVLCLLSLLLIIYNLLVNKTVGEKINKKGISRVSLAVFVISLIFIFAKGPVGGFLPSLFNISNFEVRPSMSSTVDVIQATLTESPLLGAGPNEFVKEWAVNKPLKVNNTQFWNIDFNSGASFILTTLVNVGLLGFFAWLLFFGTIIYSGLKLLKVSRQNQFSHYISLSVFLATIYLWIFSFIYVPGIVIISLSFLFSGILLSLFYQDKIVRVKTVSLSKDRGKSVALIAVGICVFMSSVFGGYLFVKKVNASIQAQKSLVALNLEGDIGKSVELMIKATQSFGSDLYYRLLSDINLFQLQAVLNQENVAEETIREQFQIVLGNAIANAEIAVGIDIENYQNWASLSKVYGSVVPLGIEGAYDRAVESYNNAINLNPYNPSLILGLANLEIANGDIEKAKEYIMASIQMKNNYSEAYYLLSQIELETGNKAEAIPLLEQVVNLNPNFLDAIYLLGLSYDGVGKRDEAINVFSYLSQVIPDDSNIITILENLNNGRDPLFGVGQQQQQSIEIPAIELITEEDTSLELDLESDENVEVD